MVRSCLHLTQPSWRTTTPCQFSMTTYSIYLQLHSTLEAISPSTSWGCAHLFWVFRLENQNKFLQLQFIDQTRQIELYFKSPINFSYAVLCLVFTLIVDCTDPSSILKAKEFHSKIIFGTHCSDTSDNCSVQIWSIFFHGL